MTCKWCATDEAPFDPDHWLTGLGHGGIEHLLYTVSI